MQYLGGPQDGRETASSVIEHCPQTRSNPAVYACYRKDHLPGGVAVLRFVGYAPEPNPDTVRHYAPREPSSQ